MTLQELVSIASNKQNFTDLKDYVNFCEAFTSFIGDPRNIQAEIVSRNETHYRFIQFKNAEFTVSRPLNSKLLYSGKRSVKTSSKDRLDKIFVDKFLLAKLTGKDVPHVAIFLNDVQRKGKTPREYGVSTTFLPGHFKGYTIKLNPLDGVYYFDIRPNMLTENILKDHIRTFDHFLFGDLWTLLNREAVVAKIEPDETGN